MITAEDTIKSLVGYSSKDLNISMININVSQHSGVENTHAPGADKFLNDCSEFYPKLVNNYREQVEAKKDVDPKEIADKIFPSMWLSPSSMTHKKHPVDFEGDHATEKLVKEIGTYSTKQVLPLYDNASFCAALNSKRRFDSSGSKTPKLIVDEKSYTTKEVESCIERGMCTEVGIKTNEECRYIIRKPASNGKQLLTFICGSHDFLVGSVNIFKSIFTLVDIIRANNKGRNKNIIKLDNVLISQYLKGDDSDQNDALDINIAKVTLSRLIGGSIILHDHLCVLRDVYGVKQMGAFDTSGTADFTSTGIQPVIDDYARIKKYYTVAKALGKL